MTKKMAINKIPCAPQNGVSNAVNPALSPEVLLVKENNGKEENIEVVVLDDEEQEEEEEEDEEVMFQWALSTLRRTQYLSDSDSEDDNKSQPKTSGEQVSQALASQASLRWVDSNQREVLSGSVDTSPAFQEDRGDFPLHYSPVALGESEEEPLALPVQTGRGLLPLQENTQTADADIPNQSAGSSEEPSVSEGVPGHAIPISVQNLQGSSEEYALPKMLEGHAPLVVNSRETVNVKVKLQSPGKTVGRGLTHGSAINPSTQQSTSRNATSLPPGHIIDQLVAKLKRRLASPSLPGFSNESVNTASSRSKEDIVQGCKYLSQENSNSQLLTYFRKDERVGEELAPTAVGSVCSVSSKVSRDKSDVTEPANHPHGMYGVHPLEGFNAAAEPNTPRLISGAHPEGSYQFAVQPKNRDLQSNIKQKGAQADNQHTLSNVPGRGDLNITVQRYVTEPNREATVTSNLDNTQPLAGVHPDSSMSIEGQRNHLQNTSKAKPFNLSPAVVASILRDNPNISKIELTPSDSSVGATKASHYPLVIFNRHAPYIVLEDCTKTTLPRSEFGDDDGERKHILLHFYTCNICGKVYRYRSSVQRHKKTHHQVAIGDSSQDDSGENNDDRRDSDYNPEDYNESVGVPYGLREHAPKMHSFLTAESDEDERWPSGNSNYSDGHRRRKRKKRFLQRFGLQCRRRKSPKYDPQVEPYQNNANINGAHYTEENIPDYVQFFQCYLCEEKLDSEILLRSHVYRCTEAFLENTDTLAQHDKKPEPMSISLPTHTVTTDGKDTSLELSNDISTMASLTPSTRASDVLDIYPSAAGRDVYKSVCNNDSSCVTTSVSTSTRDVLLSADSFPVNAYSQYASATEPVNSHEGAFSREEMLNSGNECPSVSPRNLSVSQAISIRNVHTNGSYNQSFNDDQSSVTADCIGSKPSIGPCRSPSVTQDLLKKATGNNSLVSPVSPSSRPAVAVSVHEGNDMFSAGSNIVQFHKSSTGAPSGISVADKPLNQDAPSATSETLQLDISTPLVPINIPLTEGSSYCETISKDFDHAVSKSGKPISKRRHSDTVSATSGTMQYNNTNLIPIRNSTARDGTASAVSRTLQSVIFSSEEPAAKRHHGDNVATTPSAMQHKSTSRMPEIESVTEHRDTVSASVKTLDIAGPNVGERMNKHPVSDTDRAKSAPLQDVSSPEGPITANCTSYVNAATTAFRPLQTISNPKVPLTTDVKLHGDVVSLESRLRTTGSESEEPAAKRQCVGIYSTSSGALQQSKSTVDLPKPAALLNGTQMVMQTQIHNTDTNSDQRAGKAASGTMSHGSKELVAKAPFCSNKISATASIIVNGNCSSEELADKVVPHSDNFSIVSNAIQPIESYSEKPVMDVVSHSIGITATTSIYGQADTNSQQNIVKVAASGDMTFSMSSKQDSRNGVSNPGLAVPNSVHILIEDSINVPVSSAPSSKSVNYAEHRTSHHVAPESILSVDPPLENGASNTDTSAVLQKPLLNADVSKQSSMETTMPGSSLMGNASITKASSGESTFLIPSNNIGNEIADLMPSVMSSSLGEDTVTDSSSTLPKDSSSEGSCVVVTPTLPSKLKYCNPNSEQGTEKPLPHDVKKSTSGISHQSDSCLGPSANVFTASSPYSDDGMPKPKIIHGDVSDRELPKNSTPSCAPVRGCRVNPLVALNSSVGKPLTKEGSQYGTTSATSRNTSRQASNVRAPTDKETLPFQMAAAANADPLNCFIPLAQPTNSVSHRSLSSHRGNVSKMLNKTACHILDGQVSYTSVPKMHLYTPLTCGSVSSVPSTTQGMKISIADMNSRQPGSLHSLPNIVFPVSKNAADTVMAGSLSVLPPVFTCFGQPSNLPHGILITNAAGAAAERTIVVPALPSGRPANLAETSPFGVTVSLPKAPGIISVAQGSLFHQGTNINPLITPLNIPSVLTSSGSSSISQQVYGESTGKNAKKVSGSPFTIFTNGSNINTPGTVVISKKAVGGQRNISEVNSESQSSIASCSSSVAANIRTDPYITSSKYRKILPKS